MKDAMVGVCFITAIGMVVSASGLLDALAKGSTSYQLLQREHIKTQQELDQLRLMHQGYQDGVKDSQ